MEEKETHQKANSSAMTAESCIAFLSAFAVETCIAFLCSHRSSLKPTTLKGRTSAVGPVSRGKSKYSKSWEQMYWYFLPAREEAETQWNDAISGHCEWKNEGFQANRNENGWVSFTCQSGTPLYDAMVETNFFQPRFPTAEWHQLFDAEINRRQRAGKLPAIRSV